MANNLPAFKTEVENLLINTNNLDTTFKQKMRDRMKNAYPNKYAQYLADNSLVDNPTSRGKFLVFMTVDDYWHQVWNAQHIAEQPPTSEDPYG